MNTLRLPRVYRGMKFVPLDWYLGVEAALKAIWPQQGTGMLLSMTNGGTMYSVARMIKCSGGRDMFPVDLTQTGGSAGSPTTTCSFTYTVKERESSVTIGTSLAVVGKRIPNCAMTAGVLGLARYKNDGTLELLWADEVPVTKTATVHQIRYDTTTKSFQLKARNIVVLDAEDAGAWTDLATGEESLTTPCTPPGS